MKKITAFALCFLMLFAAACQKSEARDNNEMFAPSGTNETSGASLDAENTVSSGDNTTAADTETNAAASVPIPSNVSVIGTDKTLSEEITQLASDGRVSYRDVADYISELEAAGFTSAVEYWNDGIRHVKAVKDNITVCIDFTHDNRDDIFEDKIATGEEVSGMLDIRIYAEKAA